MVAKYRLRYEDIDRWTKTAEGKLKLKDEMLWEYDRFIIGISQGENHFIINHYSKDYDKSEYIMVEENYSLDKYSDDWWDHTIEVWEANSKRIKEKNGNV